MGRLRRGELIAGAGALALSVALFALPWYKPRGKPGLDGWQGLTHVRWLLALTIVAALLLVFLQAARDAPALPVSMSVIVTVLALLSVLWLLYRVILNPPSGQQAGAVLGFLSACAILVGGFLSMRDEGIAPRDAPREIPTVTLRSR